MNDLRLVPKRETIYEILNPSYFNVYSCLAHLKNALLDLMSNIIIATHRAEDP